MTWKFVPLEIKPQPRQPINILVVAKLINDDTGEEIALPDNVFAHDMTPERLAEQAGALIDALYKRDSAMTRLKSEVPVNQELTPTMPKPAEEIKMP